jgi:serine/threonine protein kinase
VKSAIYGAVQGTRLFAAKVYTLEGRESFEREAIAHEAVGDHPHISRPVHVQRFGTINTTHVGLFVFPRYPISISQRLSKYGVLDNDVVFAIATDILDALSHMHSRNLVHCDVKPSNVMLDAHGRAVLIDLASSVEVGLGVVESTSHYALGLHRGAASFALDCRCVAVSMFHMLTCRMPASLDLMMDDFNEMTGTAASLAQRCANATSIADVLPVTE